MSTRVSLVVALLAVGALGIAHGNEPWPRLRVRSDRSERIAPDVQRMTGRVVARSDTWTLRADSLETHINRAADKPAVELFAEGNVVLERGQERLSLKRLQLDTRTGRGTFELPNH
jgi:hypothetical protein